MRVPPASAEKPLRRTPRAERPRRDDAGGRPTGGRNKSAISRDKRLERERRMRERRIRALLRVGLLVAVVVAALAAGTWLYRSPLLAVERVEVAGADRLGAERVREIAAVPAEATLLRVSAPAIEKRLKAEPWVADAEVHRRPPHTLLIEITERHPEALVDTGGAALWLVDGDGFVIAERSAEESSPLIVVRDVPELKPAPGAHLRSGPIDNALAVIRGLSDELRGQVRAISAPTVDKTALHTRDDVEVFIGPVSGLEQKDLVTRTILEEQRGKVVYINVRTVERPTWRGLETGE